MKHIDFEQIEDIPQNTRPTPGHYVARIQSCIDVPEKEYLRIEFDIAYGQLSGCARNSYAYRMEGTWPRWATIYISYKATALWRFKQFRNQLEETNRSNGFRWTSEVFDDLTKLHGLFFGIIYKQENYDWNGMTGTHSMPAGTETGQAAKAAGITN